MAVDNIAGFIVTLALLSVYFKIYNASLFEESSVHLNISKTIGKTKETKTTKEVKATTSKTIEKTEK